MTPLAWLFLVLLLITLYILKKAWKLIKQQDLKITNQTKHISKQDDKLRKKGIIITQLKKSLSKANKR